MFDGNKRTVGDQCVGSVAASAPSSCPSPQEYLLRSAPVEGEGTFARGVEAYYRGFPPVPELPDVISDVIPMATNKTKLLPFGPTPTSTKSILSPLAGESQREGEVHFRMTVARRRASGLSHYVILSLRRAERSAPTIGRKYSWGATHASNLLAWGMTVPAFQLRCQA